MTPDETLALLQALAKLSSAIYYLAAAVACAVGALLAGLIVDLRRSE